MNNNKRSTRNWFLTLFALMIAGFIGWAAVVCWTNLHHDTFMIGAAAVLTCTSLLFLLAAVTGKAEDFFLALIAWW